MAAAAGPELRHPPPRSQADVCQWIMESQRCPLLETYFVDASFGTIEFEMGVLSLYFCLNKKGTHAKKSPLKTLFFRN